MLRKYLKYILPVLALSAMPSCTEDVMDHINTQDHRPGAEIVDGKLQVTDAIMSTAFTTLSGDYSFYVSSFNEQLFGTGHNQLARAELRDKGEIASSTTFNNVWNGTYANILNLRQLLEKCQEGGVNAGQSDIRGIGEVLWVLNFGALTDLHGDIPYSEATLVLQPKMDSQESIYADLLARTDRAISDLKAADAAKMNNCGTQDILYGGSPKKWLGLAYALKAKLLLNTGFRNPGAYGQIAAVAGEAIAAGFNGAELRTFNGVDCDNPWSAYHWSRQYTGANGTLYDLMAERNDPRLPFYAADGYGNGITYAPAGDRTLAEATVTVGFPVWLDNGGQSVHILSLADFYFTLAEAKARTGGDFASDMAMAIEASFADWTDACGEPVEGVGEYIAGLPVTLEELMVQKYISSARDEHLQMYNDIRRFRAEGKEIVTLRNPNNRVGSINLWPLRLPYANSDVLSNPNVKEAFGSGNEAGNYIYTENVWLFGGKR